MRYGEFMGQFNYRYGNQAKDYIILLGIKTQRVMAKHMYA